MAGSTHLPGALVALLEGMYRRHPKTYALMIQAVTRPSYLPDMLGRVNRHNARVIEATTLRCTCCGHEGHPVYLLKPVNHYMSLGASPVRDNVICRSCGSTMRHRAMLAVVTELIAEHVEPPKVLDTDDSWPGRQVVAARSDYLATTFDPDRAPGEMTGRGLRNEDLRHLTLPDNSIDLAMSSDVHEHIYETMAAFAEVRRVLKPGGAYVFTVPYNPEMVENRCLAVAEGDKHIWIGTEQMHGDPRNRAGIPAYWLFGQQLLTDLSGIGLEARVHPVIPEGGPKVGVDVFVARKGS